ncbi:MAG: Gfo/Idh/MocA family oxidoreductase [Kiritimatiellae bacterium]|nr:Gfo/Idh/MocA family oxidoreductase [Kiritimatiellia bacterium]
MDKVRVGIIGAGKIARNHAKVGFPAAKAEVVAAADINEAALNALGDEFGIAQRYTDWKDLVARDDIDAVSVALPPFLHAPATLDALKAGKHVLCEKPMSCTVAEAEAMVQAAKEADRKLMVYYRRRLLNATQKAKAIIESGALGTVYFARTAGYRFRGRPNIDMKNLSPWFNDPAKAGGGVLFDLGGYALDQLCYLLGWPALKSVCAQTYREIDREATEKRGFNVDEFVVGMIRFRNGATAWLEGASAVNMDPRQAGGTKLFGDKAGLDAGSMTLYKPDAEGQMQAETIDVPPQEQGANHSAICVEFVNAILKDRPLTVCTGEEGLYVQRILCGMQESAEKGCEVEV